MDYKLCSFSIQRKYNTRCTFDEKKLHPKRFKRIYQYDTLNMTQVLNRTGTPH